MSAELGARLRSAIFADLSNDGPRAVYADWLLEHGDRYGAFIAAQLRGDEQAACEEVQWAIAAQRLTIDPRHTATDGTDIRPSRVRCFTRGLINNVLINGASMPLLGEDAWPTVERLRLASPEEGQFLAELAPRLVSLTQFRGGSEESARSLAHFRPRPLRALRIDVMREWIELGALVDEKTHVELRTNEGFSIQRTDTGVHIALVRRNALPLERVLRLLVRPTDAVTVAYPFYAARELEELRTILSRVDHASFAEYPNGPVG